MNGMTKILAMSAISSACASAWANPTGAAVARGAALLSNPSANLLQVVNTPGTVINWQGFSIGATETTRFVQQNAASAVLNRVAGASPSSILGRLESNGRVFLINPNGIVFGGSAVVDVAGLIASTRNISDANFAAGNYLFEGAGAGAITVQTGAQILTSTYGAGGQVWLFAGNVTQEAGSTITAPQGQVILAAGSRLQVGTSNLGAMTFDVQNATGSSVQALGDIVAARGAVGFFADQLNIAGKVSARSAADGAGSIVVVAGTDLTVGNGGVLDVSADGAGVRAGSITLDAARTLEVKQSGLVLAESIDGLGGQIVLRGNEILLPRKIQDWDNMLQNVRAFGRDGASDGSVTLAETGTIAVTLSPTPLTQQSFVEYDANGSSIRMTTIALVLQAGDGAILVGREDRDPNTRQASYIFEIIRNGQRTSLGTLLSATNTQQGEIDVSSSSRGLAAGGWVWKRGLDVRFISPQGQVTATVTLPSSGAWDVVPLASGAVKLNSIFDDSQSRVFSAAGVELLGAERAAALGAGRSVPFAQSGRPNSAAATGPSIVENGSFRIEPITEQHVRETEDGTGLVTENVVIGQSFITEGTYQLARAGQAPVAMPMLSSSSNANWRPSSDGRQRNAQESVYYLSSGSVRDTAMGGREIPIVKTMNSSGFVEIGNGARTYTSSASQELYLATRAATNTPGLRSTVGASAGLSAAFATRPGEANATLDQPAEPTPAPPQVQVVSGRPGGGSSFDESSSICNSAVCTGTAGDARRAEDAQRAIDADRIRPRDVGSMTLREFLDALIAADKAGQGDKIDDQSAAIAVQALFRAAGRQASGDQGPLGYSQVVSLQNALQDNGELRQLVLGYGDLGSMSPEGRVLVLEKFMREQNADQRQGVEGVGSTAGQISIRGIVANLTTRDEMHIFMETVNNAIRGWLE